MILKYISAKGTEFDLKTVGGLRARSADLHTYEWVPDITELQFGVKVNRFRKEASAYIIKLDAGGTLAQRKQYLNELHAAFDEDIYNKTPGRIVHGDYYVQCYVIVSSTYAEDPYTSNEVTAYCPYPFWVKDNTWSFAKQESTAAANQYLDFEYDFPYDYTSDQTGQGTVQNAGSGPANYKLIVYGGCSNPYIMVDDRIIGVNTVLGDDEYMVIDSRENTVVRVTNSGSRINLYNNRIKTGVSIFDQIDPGFHSVIWPGTFGFDLTIYEERSEPAWS